MKAEHRKELETNTLADKMGQMMNRVKGGERRIWLIRIIVTVVVIVAIVWPIRWYQLRKQQNSDQWARLYDGSPTFIVGMVEKDAEAPYSKAARFQIAWHFYWELGVKKLGSDPRGGLIEISKAGQLYQGLAKDCKDDPLLEPEALLGLAVVEEARAIQDVSNLESAKEKYEDLITRSEGKYKDSAQGKFAQSRLDQLKANNDEVKSLYKQLQKMWGVPAPGVMKLKDGKQPNPFDEP